MTALLGAALAILLCSSEAFARQPNDLLNDDHPRFRVGVPGGVNVLYRITNLGTRGQVQVAVLRPGQTEAQLDPELTRVANELQLGEGRPFRLSENLFDGVVGTHVGNWRGSDWSGRMPIDPNGIGPVDVPCADRQDCLAKQHDIEFWIGRNFERGALVDVLVGERWVRMPARPVADVNNDVMGNWLLGRSRFFAPGRVAVWIREPQRIHETHGRAQEWTAWARSLFPENDVTFISPQQRRVPPGVVVRTLAGGPAP